MSVQTNQRTLRRGSRGEDVQRLQSFLNHFSFGPLNEDGDFGSATEAAVKRYQSSLGLIVDGIVGPETWSRINHDLGN